MTLWSIIFLCLKAVLYIILKKLNLLERNGWKLPSFIVDKSLDISFGRSTQDTSMSYWCVSWPKRCPCCAGVQGDMRVVKYHTHSSLNSPHSEHILPKICSCQSVGMQSSKPYQWLIVLFFHWKLIIHCAELGKAQPHASCSSFSSQHLPPMTATINAVTSCHHHQECPRHHHPLKNFKPILWPMWYLILFSLVLIHSICIGVLSGFWNHMP
jgi:hypothetical protein